MFFNFLEAAFLPTHKPDLQLWLDAADTSAISATTQNVTAWADKSGNGNGATTTIGTPRTGDSTENGLNIIDFTTDQMSLPSALYSIPNGPYTVFMVSKRASEDASIDATFGMATGATNQMFHIYSNTSGVMSFTNNLTGAGSVSTTGKTNTNLSVTRLRRTGTYQGISVNSETELFNASASNASGVDDAFIGTAGSGGFPLIGSIAEFIIYDRFFSVPEANTVENYLSAKWGI